MGSGLLMGDSPPDGGVSIRIRCCPLLGFHSDRASQIASEDSADCTGGPWEVPLHSAGSTVHLSPGWPHSSHLGFPRSSCLTHAKPPLTPQAFPVAVDMQPHRHRCVCVCSVYTCTGVCMCSAGVGTCVYKCAYVQRCVYTSVCSVYMCTGVCVCAHVHRCVYVQCGHA